MCNFCQKKSLEIINLYQKYLSPDHSFWAKERYPIWYCKYFPSCSEYTKLAIKKYWCIKWYGKWIFRIIRCNPFSKGGVDLP